MNNQPEIICCVCFTEIGSKENTYQETLNQITETEDYCSEYCFLVKNGNEDEFDR